MRTTIGTIALLAFVTLTGCREVGAPLATARTVAPVKAISQAGDPVTLELSIERDADGATTAQWREEITEGSFITVRASCIHADGGDTWLGGDIVHADAPSLVGSSASIRLSQRADGSVATSYTVLSASGGCNAEPLPLVGTLSVVAAQ